MRKSSSKLGAEYDYMHGTTKKYNDCSEMGPEYDSYYTAMDYHDSNEPAPCEDDEYFTDIRDFTNLETLKVPGEPQSKTTSLSDPKLPMFNIVKQTCP